jgi:tetratricopeptide (TPR) repeat protein
MRNPRLFRSTVFVASLALGSAAIAASVEDVNELMRLQRVGNSAEALQLADRLLVAKPKDAQVRFLKGVVLADSRRGTEAIDVFRQLTEDYPELAEPYNNLAALHAAAGEYDKARAALEQALRSNPGYATAHENLGDVYAMLASQSYGRALNLEPGNASVPPKLALVRQLFTPQASPAASAPSK